MSALESACPEVSPLAVFFRSQPGQALGPGAAAVFSWARLAFGCVLLLLLLFGAIGTAGEAALAQIHQVLVHAFELVLGAVVGILTAEAATS